MPGPGHARLALKALPSRPPSAGPDGRPPPGPFSPGDSRELTKHLICVGQRNPTAMRTLVVSLLAVLLLVGSAQAQSASGDPGQALNQTVDDTKSILDKTL